MATLRELAERTGYSPATISRILTGDPALAVSEEARKRVLEEAGRLNYAATKSRRGRSRRPNSSGTRFTSTSAAMWSRPAWIKNMRFFP